MSAKPRTQSISSRYRHWKSIWGLEIHPVVFLVSAGAILVFVLLSLLFIDHVGGFFEALQSWVATNFGWFYILAVNAFLVFVVFILVGPFGRIRLGGARARPDYGYWSWFSMLFSAGMGIGLLFWSVAEPMFHFAEPPLQDVEASSVDAAREAMLFTFYHWGLHAWAIYALVGLALGFFAFNRGLPLTIRSVFHPLLGDRIHGWAGNLIDILAVVATLFGVATSLGFGVGQVNAGLHYLFPSIPQSNTVQIVLITVITAMATVSVVLGLDKGIKRLSEINLCFGLALLLFVLFLGPTLFIMKSLVQNIGMYASHFVELSFWTEAYRDDTWQQGWTIFYWGWWIAWSPFVGMFIARISRGRTIREFLLGVLLVPSTLTFVWLTVFGNTALHTELFGTGGLAAVVQENIPVALFALLAKFPLAMFTSLLAVVVVVTFFVTSSDSGSLVIDTITAGGNTNPPVVQKVFWAVTEGVVAAVLLVGGGLGALQTGSITTGLPFAVVVCLLCWSLYKGLNDELDVRDEKASAPRQEEVEASLRR